MWKKLSRTIWMLAGMSVMLLGGAAAAEADDRMVATVPFEFTAGDVHLPAGTYEVAQLTNLGVVSIASTDRRHFVFLLTNAMSPEKAGPEPELVFERVGENYFLERVVTGDFRGRELLLRRDRLERSAERVAVAMFQPGVAR
jgi:hypothetical protein